MELCGVPAVNDHILFCFELLRNYKNRNKQTISMRIINIHGKLKFSHQKRNHSKIFKGLPIVRKTWTWKMARSRILSLKACRQIVTVQNHKIRNISDDAFGKKREFFLFFLLEKLSDFCKDLTALWTRKDNVQLWI